MTPEEQIDAVVLDALEEIGRDVVFAIQLEISDLYPPSSDPNTPPHLRTGNLQRGIHHTVEQFHDGYTLTIISDMFYGEFLRDGTSAGLLPRRFFNQAMVDHYTPYVIQRLQAAFPVPSVGGAGPPVNSAYGMIYPTPDLIAA